MRSRVISLVLATLLTLVGCSSGPTWGDMCRKYGVEPFVLPYSNEKPGHVVIVQEGNRSSPYHAHRPEHAADKRHLHALSLPPHLSFEGVEETLDRSFGLDAVVELSDSFRATAKAGGAVSVKLIAKDVVKLVLPEGTFYEQVSPIYRTLLETIEYTPKGESVEFITELLLVRFLSYSFRDSSGASIGTKLELGNQDGQVWKADIGVKFELKNGSDLVYEAKKGKFDNYLCLGYKSRSIVPGRVRQAKTLSLPQPTKSKSHASSKRINSPMAGDSCLVDATLTLTGSAPGITRLSLKASTDNGALTDNVTAEVSVQLFKGSDKVEEIRVRVPSTPAKGWPWNRNTRRSKAVAREVEVPNLVYDRVEWEFRNVHHESNKPKKASEKLPAEVRITYGN